MPRADAGVRAGAVGDAVETLIVSVAALGLAVAFSSPTSVLAVLVLLDLPSGIRRAIAFVIGWVVTIAVIGAVVVLVPALDFRTSQTTPSRLASIAEIVIGAALIVGAVVLNRRPVSETAKDPVPQWLTNLVGRHWAVALAAGGVMLTYSITLVAALEILKANVGTVDRVVALIVFAAASIVTITAPILFSALAPQRAVDDRSRLRRWIAKHQRTIGVALLAAIGAAIILKAVFDLAS